LTPSDEATTVVDERARRLHPASLIFGIFTLVRQFLIPAILFLFFARGGEWQRWMLLPFGYLLIAELVRYATFTYRFTAEELVVRSGLFSRTERHIPYERVQNIELIENAVHRLIGVAQVRLQTGSGTELEADFKVISRAAVEELRRATLTRRREAGVEAKDEASTVVLRLPLSEVALHGLLTGRGLVVLAALAGLAFEFNIDWDDYIERFLRERFFPAEIAEWQDAFQTSTRALLWWSLVFIPAVFVLRLLSAAWAVVRLYDFTLERAGEGLQSRYGLLTRVSATIPRARVQVLTVEEGVFHRWLRRTSVRVDTAGQFKQEAGQLGSQWIAPILGVGALRPLVREVQPDADLDPPAWQPVHPRAFTRMVRVTLVLLFVLTLIPLRTVGPYVVLPALLLAVVAVWHARLLSRRLAVALTPTSVIVRTGAFRHRRSIARFARIQSVSLTQSPLDRRWRMATVSVDTAGGSAEQRIVVPYLPADRAQEIYVELKAQVAKAVSALTAQSPPAGTTSPRLRRDPP
jgi:putative membrane protein